MVCQTHPFSWAQSLHFVPAQLAAAGGVADAAFGAEPAVDEDGAGEAVRPGALEVALWDEAPDDAESLPHAGASAATTRIADRRRSRETVDMSGSSPARRCPCKDSRLVAATSRALMAP